jgi:hypothetical protein
VESFSLLRAFEATFQGRPYKHRVSTTGDLIASQLYEDLLALGESRRFVERVKARQGVVNTSNQIKGKKGRRGDGTFGRLVPGIPAAAFLTCAVPRGPVANLEIGAEVKIMATKMIAQIDRVTTDLNNQATVFKRLNPNCIAIAFVGVNHALEYLGLEGERQFVAKKPPATEASEIIRRIERDVAPNYDELLILPFNASNKPPYSFSWVREHDVRERYASLLVRVSDLYDRRFA